MTHLFTARVYRTFLFWDTFFQCCGTVTIYYCPNINSSTCTCPLLAICAQSLYYNVPVKIYLQIVCSWKKNKYIMFYSILFYSILFYSILFYSILLISIV